MLSIVYDWHPDDPRTTSVVERIYQMAHRLAYAAIPGNYLVEMFPIMLHLPDWLAGWKRDGRAWFKKDSEMFIELLKGVQDKMYGRVGNSTCLQGQVAVEIFLNSTLTRLRLLYRQRCWHLSFILKLSVRPMRSSMPS
ncbi:hypothetical protein EIP86_001473 [Pleurotus ostreatoroseus]|nr:hypothetical protein EIP86_001473 [Pleurotus ostreatoroseus]